MIQQTDPLILGALDKPRSQPCRAVGWSEDGPTDDRCEMPSAGVATFGCVHEHQRVGPLCSLHRLLAEGATCLACATGGEPHDCPLTLIGFEPVEAS